MSAFKKTTKIHADVNKWFQNIQKTTWWSQLIYTANDVSTFHKLANCLLLLLL